MRVSEHLYPYATATHGREMRCLRRAVYHRLSLT